MLNAQTTLPLPPSRHITMALPRSLLQYICSLVLFIACAQALKFDIEAKSQSSDRKNARCIRNFVGRDTLVVVTVIVSGSKGDGMSLNTHVSLADCQFAPPPLREGGDANHGWARDRS